jgi:predicted transcriptional regulator YheO
MKREEMLQILDRLAKGIAEMFGSACETLVHDMETPSHAILVIYNGHVSGRTVGSTMDILGRTRDLEAGEDMINLLAQTPAGRQVKTTTFWIKGEDYAFGLGINFDFSALTYANRILVDLMSSEADLRSVLQSDGEGPLEDIFEECAAAVGKPIGSFHKRDRMKLMTMLEQKNAFSFRKSVPYVAKKLDVSRYTIYKYLDELAREREPKEVDLERNQRGED